MSELRRTLCQFANTGFGIGYILQDFLLITS